mmetsp:Transcript_20392/g.68440  ORF Transcript_20392/g.68440 Transcript_20392/m.68440 type:complete len:315 (-) Transcript_20392:114-1058(-)
MACCTSPWPRTCPWRGSPCASTRQAAGRGCSPSPASRRALRGPRTRLPRPPHRPPASSRPSRRARTRSSWAPRPWCSPTGGGTPSWGPPSAGPSPPSPRCPPRGRSSSISPPCSSPRRRRWLVRWWSGVWGGSPRWRRAPRCPWRAWGLPSNPWSSRAPPSAPRGPRPLLSQSWLRLLPRSGASRWGHPWSCPCGCPRTRPRGPSGAACSASACPDGPGHGSGPSAGPSCADRCPGAAGHKGQQRQGHEACVAPTTHRARARGPVQALMAWRAWLGQRRWSRWVHAEGAPCGPCPRTAGLTRCPALRPEQPAYA